MRRVFPPRVPALELYAGDSFQETVRFRDQGAPVDLSAWTDWKAEWRSGDRIEVFGVDTTQLASGFVTLMLEPSQTRGMEPAGTWDLQAVRGSEVRTWCAGSTTWRIDVTGRP